MMLTGYTATFLRAFWGGRLEACQELEMRAIMKNHGLRIGRSSEQLRVGIPHNFPYRCISKIQPSCRSALQEFFALSFKK
jgi:hypothetical protein